jgi:ATP-dependent phosphoenolpyruvate carboxykinase
MKTEYTDKEESLRKLGLLNLGHVHWDLSTADLYEESISRYEGILSHLSPLVIRTGQFTGRLPKDKFLVREPSSENKIFTVKLAITRAMVEANLDKKRRRCSLEGQKRRARFKLIQKGLRDFFRTPPARPDPKPFAKY